MNTETPGPRLVLVVANPQALQLGSAPRHSFDPAGGTIGSRHADWMLHDRAGLVHPRHCEIRHVDGGFLVIDRCGNTSVNDQTRPLGDGVSVRLRDADTLHIGPYHVSVHLDDAQHQLPDPARSLAEHSIDEVLAPSDSGLEPLPDGAPDDMVGAPAVEPGLAEFQALAEPPRPQGQLDPLEALEAAERLHSAAVGDVEALDPRHYGLTPLSAQADLATTAFEAVHGSPMLAPGDPRMSEHPTSSPSARQWLHGQQSGGNDPAGLVTPLIEGIGAPVGALDAQAAYALLYEAGQTIGALIRGLAALHEGEPGRQHRLAFAGRTLQPIEDNPLRLGQSYPETVSALFSAQRSVVHLSPQAAVEESLEGIRRQHNAMQAAIAAGLNALLKAFSPEQLQQRFRRYRSGELQPPQAGDWCWNMYQHYYDELISSRQQGFDKLFWEVFDQAYDQALRAEE